VALKTIYTNVRLYESLKVFLQITCPRRPEDPTATSQIRCQKESSRFQIQRMIKECLEAHYGGKA